VPALLSEWLNLLLRWTHVIAAIMWIGDSFLFMWMDSNLVPASRPREGDVAGELWMVHSGGFYEVVKRRVLQPGEIPAALHWFKWQSYMTWISGMALLMVVYWAGGTAFMVDRDVLPMTGLQAIGASIAVLVLGWLVYDGLWSSPLKRNPRVASIVSLVLLAGAIVGLMHVFSPRAAWLHAGAMMATIMAGNVWRRIIPAQTQMLAATRAGERADATLGARAKQRSIHNHYLTLPVVFAMLSNHFPAMYGRPNAPVVLMLFVAFGMAFKAWMNFRGRTAGWIVATGVVSLAGLITLTVIPDRKSAVGAAPAMAPVSYATVHAIIERRCLTCHSKHPTNPSFPQAPLGIMFDDRDRVVALAPRIRIRAVETKTMPLGNMTGITQAERDTLAAWIDAGAKGD
jgi:uncharacterized membrane protein